MSIRLCLWFHKDGLAAARFYCGLIAGSTIESDASEGQPEPLVVLFNLGGVLPCQILNGGPNYTLTPASSISVQTKSQDETDRLWNALLRDGGTPNRCGWLQDRWGVSWQIVPDRLPALMGAADREAAGRAREAMFLMDKLDVAVLEAAFEGRALHD
jgi:predicted 3-demethylubiquinone-9 3-methyltransferase (glyoxalase superfamily)